MLSTELFNVGAVTQVFCSKHSVTNAFADDSLDILAAKTNDELNRIIQETANEKSEWFRNCGLTINEDKTELIGFFGFEPADITINTTVVHPKSALKYLGVTLQSDLKFNEHISNLCLKLRRTAGCIRTLVANFDVSDRIVLLNGWARGSLNSNALAYLPSLSATLLDRLDKAYNTCIRSVFSLPKYGPAPLSELKTEFRASGNSVQGAFNSLPGKTVPTIPVRLHQAQQLGQGQRATFPTLACGAISCPPSLPDNGTVFPWIFAPMKTSKLCQRNCQSCVCPLDLIAESY